jgi:hypothetical protein
LKATYYLEANPSLAGKGFFTAEAPSTQRNNGTRMNTDSHRSSTVDRFGELLLPLHGLAPADVFSLVPSGKRAPFNVPNRNWNPSALSRGTREKTSQREALAHAVEAEARQIRVGQRSSVSSYSSAFLCASAVRFFGLRLCRSRAIGIGIRPRSGTRLHLAALFGQFAIRNPQSEMGRGLLA